MNLTSNDVNVQERYHEYHDAFKAFGEHPFVGAGIGNLFSYAGNGQYVNYIHNFFYLC
ncbi:hypothetical protein CV093_17920 [Oceanobacillus sp. 143]|nr:hypothetical protein CV093_17920 [Oceanobacillus sp. 143]